MFVLVAVILRLQYCTTTTITLGRKNYLFCGNHEAAANMCIITSLLATCRNHNINPRLYLGDVIARMPYMEKASAEELIGLLPHRWIKKHPEGSIEKRKDVTEEHAKQ